LNEFLADRFDQLLGNPTAEVVDAFSSDQMKISSHLFHPLVYH
jgi:hypothetical protein